MLVLSVKYRYHTDPSGTFVRYDAKAIGSGSEAAQSELQDKWHSVCSLVTFIALYY
jgi:20S proteasome alpha/beta subunit